MHLILSAAFILRMRIILRDCELGRELDVIRPVCDFRQPRQARPAKLDCVKRLGLHRVLGPCGAPRYSVDDEVRRDLLPEAVTITLSQERCR